MKADTGATGASAYTIHRLNFGSVVIDEAGLVRGREPGTVTTVPAQGFLITGGPGPILIDAGFRNPSVLGSGGEILPEQEFHAQLAAHGITPADLHGVLMTHLHRDHAGHLDKIPMSVPVTAHRAEMGAAFSGLQSLAYARDDLHHLVDRHHEGGLRLLDLDQSGPLQILPGITCYATGGHTAGSMSITVTTAEGTACLCGDLVYDLDAALLHHPDQTPTARMQPAYLDPAAPTTTANYTPSLAQEIAALQRLTGSGYRFVLPAHDDPGVLDPGTGALIGRIGGDVIPGPVTPIQPTTRPTTPQKEA